MTSPDRKSGHSSDPTKSRDRQMEEEIDQHTLVAQAALDSYKDGKINKQAAANMIANAIFAAQTAVTNLSRTFVAENDAGLGLDSLVNNRNGNRTRAYLEQSGLAFATGHVTSAIAVMAVNPELGAGAANRNAFTEADTKEIVKRLLDKERLDFLQSGLRPETFRAMIPMGSLTNTVNSAVGSAIDQLALLAPQGIPLQGTQIGIAGPDFLDPKQIGQLQTAFRKAVSQHRAFRTGKHLGQSYAISLDPHLGQAGGFLYGPGHPNQDYRELAFYKME